MNEYALRFLLNGEPTEVTASPNSTLLDVLRNKLKLTSVKRGCGRGECGACTVLLDGKAVCSCLILAPMVSDRAVLTIEGLGKQGNLHPLQEAFMEHAAIQCGFCTSGMLLSAKALLDERPNPTEEEVRRGISGNLCRCTGYVPVIEAILDAARRISNEAEK
jgi:carbon-monoxide dehydrogenase small subunit